jgi:hypothetical protein
MNINAANSQNISQIQNVQAIDPIRRSYENGELETGAQANKQEVSISQTGQISSYIANLPEDEQQEIKQYLESTREAKADGSFDIEASINNAPEAFNNLVKQLNLDSEEMLNVMSEKPPKPMVNASAESTKPPGISTYADIAEQTESNESNSLSDMFSSFFSSNSKEVI